jgi:hypothetical protein
VVPAHSDAIDPGGQATDIDGREAVGGGAIAELTEVVSPPALGAAETRACARAPALVVAAARINLHDVTEAADGHRRRAVDIRPVAELTSVVPAPTLHRCV